jgi:hypothetical protein
MERRRSSGVRNLLKFNGRVDIFAESAWTHSAEISVIISEPKRVIAGLITYVESKNNDAQKRVA